MRNSTKGPTHVERQQGVAHPKAPIACTLGSGDFKARVAWIAELARESLREVRRAPLTLHLIYAPEASEKARQMVQREQACCAFLAFEVTQDFKGIHVRITAPSEARDMAAELFAHFAPELSPEQTKETTRHA